MYFFFFFLATFSLLCCNVRPNMQIYGLREKTNGLFLDGCKYTYIHFQYNIYMDGRQLFSVNAVSDMNQKHQIINTKPNKT